MAGVESLDDDLDSDDSDLDEDGGGRDPARVPGQARTSDISLGQVGQLDQSLEDTAVAAASVAAAEAAEAEVATAAGETVFPPATRLTLLRHLLMGMPWPDHHAAGLVQAACNPGTSPLSDSALGGGINTMTEPDESGAPLDEDRSSDRRGTPGGRTSWVHSDPGWALSSGTAAVGPQQFQFLHDPEVMDQLEEVAQAALWH